MSPHEVERKSGPTLQNNINSSKIATVGELKVVTDVCQTKI